MVFKKIKKKKVKEIEEEPKKAAEPSDLEKAEQKLKDAEEKVSELKGEKAETEEEPKETKQAEAKREFIVVNELPTQQARIAVGDDKKEYELVTRDEALTEILQTMRELKEEE